MLLVVIPGEALIIQLVSGNSSQKTNKYKNKKSMLLQSPALRRLKQEPVDSRPAWGHIGHLRDTGWGCSAKVAQWVKELATSLRT